MAEIPSIVDGPQLAVKRKIEYDLPCPNCTKEMRVTNVNEGAVIKCSECGNKTWRPAYVPPWWSRTRNFILSLVVAILVGLVTGFFSSLIFEKYQKARDSGVDSQLPGAIKK